MNISEMHVWFRQYAQQMGMQNVRAILPEQIDILINTSITDTLNDIIRRNIGISNDRIITDNSKIGQINALKFLYKVKDIPFLREVSTLNTTEELENVNISDFNKLRIVITDKEENTNSYTFDVDSNLNSNIISWLESINCEVSNFLIIPGTNTEIQIECKFDNLLDNITFIGIDGTTESTLLEIDSFTDGFKNNFIFKNKNFYSGLIKYNSSLENYLFLVDFSIDYATTSRGFNENELPIYTEDFKTNLFPLRLIDDSYLADTLNDFILKPRLRSPIMIIYNNQIDIYLGKLVKNGSYYTLENGLVPNTIRMSYIAKPKVVKYSEDINGTNVDCDLPDYMHVDILKHAVDLYNISISGNLQAARQQQDNQTRENVRNNANIYDENIRN